MNKAIYLILILSSFSLFACTRAASHDAQAGDAPAAEAAAGSGEAGQAADAGQTADAGKQAGIPGDPDKSARAEARYVDDAGQPLGLQLEIAAVLPGEVTEIEHQVGADGLYKRVWLYEGMVSYSLERLPKAELGEGGVREAFARLEPDAYDASLRPEDDMKRQLGGAVAWKWFYSTGHNEDTRTNTDYYVQRDDFDYRFKISVPADFVEEYARPVKSLVNGLVFVTR
ncbi:MAG: hypothetical protein IKY83_02915 [Proteobacteria bacterium]|nr:hypothetical protein [Pseudomonadota bacterium]